MNIISGWVLKWKNNGYEHVNVRVPSNIDNSTINSPALLRSVHAHEDTKILIRRDKRVKITLIVKDDMCRGRFCTAPKHWWWCWRWPMATNKGWWWICEDLAVLASWRASQNSGWNQLKAETETYSTGQLYNALWWRCISVLLDRWDQLMISQ